MDSILTKRYASLYRSSETVQQVPALYPNYPATLETQASTQTVYSAAELNRIAPYGTVVRSKAEMQLSRAHLLQRLRYPRPL
jgi:hypothetical protein